MVNGLERRADAAEIAGCFCKRGRLVAGLSILFQVAVRLLEPSADSRARASQGRQQMRKRGRDAAAIAPSTIE